MNRDVKLYLYDIIDYEEIWTAIKDELPLIRPNIKSFLIELKSH